LYRRPRLIYSASFGLAALIVAARADPSLPSQLLVAAAAGVLIGLGNRLWMAAIGMALLAWALAHHAVVAPSLWLISVVLLLATALGSRTRPPRPGRAGAALPVLIAVALLPAVQGLAGWFGFLIAMSSVGAVLYASVLIAGMIAERTALAGVDPTGAVMRHLLLGRVAPGLSQDLGRSLDVITMANSNVAYIVDQLDLSPEERGQINARIARIATHSDLSAKNLGLLRWFGNEETRDIGAMTVGGALERAIAVVQPQARSAHTSIELRGDALDFPAPARQGAIEMMGAAALLDMLATKGPDDAGATARRIILDASHDGDEVAVRLLRENMPSPRSLRSVLDEVTLGLARDVAVHCGGTLRHVRRRNDPVQMVIRLKRATV